jgi:hypothetical protein
MNPENLTRISVDLLPQQKLGFGGGETNTSIGFEVLAGVNMTIIVFCVVKSCISESNQTFQRNILPPSSGLKSQPS